MNDKVERRVVKRGLGVPTIPVSSDHRNGDWIATDIYEGEVYQDTNTGMVYTRIGTDIKMQVPSDNNGFLIYNTDQKITIGAVDYEIPSAKCQAIDSGVIYTSGVEDVTIFGEGFQALVYAFNPTTLDSWGVRVTPTDVHIKFNSTRITVTDGNVNITGIPTSSAGLSTGDVWNDSGTLKIV